MLGTFGRLDVLEGAGDLSTVGEATRCRADSRGDCETCTPLLDDTAECVVEIIDNDCCPARRVAPLGINRSASAFFGGAGGTGLGNKPCKEVALIAMLLLCKLRL